MGILTALPGFSQSKSTLTLLEKSKPSVYITYVRSGPRTPLHTDESNDGVWMRVHNNTSSPLLVPGFEVPKTTGDAGFVYEVRLIPGS